MSMQLSSMASRLAAALVLSIASISASAAMIVPTGGSVTLTPSNSNPSVTVDGEYGDFSAQSQVTFTEWFPGEPEPTVTFATTASVAGNYSPYGLSLHPVAINVSGADPSQVYYGRATGTIGFDLSEDATLSFAFLQNQEAQWNTFADASFTIRDAQGDIVFGCTGGSPAYEFSFGGCAVGSQPDPTQFEDLLPDDGFMQLLAGHYDISFDVLSSSLAGTPVNSDLAFNLSVVPLPASLPLLLSGLGIFGLRRRRS